MNIGSGLLARVRCGTRVTHCLLPATPQHSYRPPAQPTAYHLQAAKSGSSVTFRMNATLPSMPAWQGRRATWRHPGLARCEWQPAAAAKRAAGAAAGGLPRRHGRRYALLGGCPLAEESQLRIRVTSGRFRGAWMLHAGGSSSPLGTCDGSGRAAGVSTLPWLSSNMGQCIPERLRARCRTRCMLAQFSSVCKSRVVLAGHAA